MNTSSETYLLAEKKNRLVNKCPCKKRAECGQFGFIPKYCKEIREKMKQFKIKLDA